jgi:hypothetical protein
MARHQGIGARVVFVVDDMDVGVAYPAVGDSDLDVQGIELRRFVAELA